MTWENLAESPAYRLTYGETDDGRTWIHSESIIDYLRHVAEQFDEEAVRVGLVGGSVEHISALVGAGRMAARLADALTLFRLDLELIDIELDGQSDGSI